MKSSLFLAIFLLATSSWAHSLLTVQGHIHAQWSGEADPFIVGDTCMVEVMTKTGQIIGLVTDFEQCSDYESELRPGRGLTVVVDRKDRIYNKEVLNVLNELSSARAYYNVEFGAIENGLADD